jgi:hypothetical protein
LTLAAIYGRTKAAEHRQADPMMNRFEGPGAKEARIRYLDGDFQVTSPGSFVRCAATGESIPLDELRYWSVARQEPYVSAAVSLKREIETDPQLRRRG